MMDLIMVSGIVVGSSYIIDDGVDDVIDLKFKAA